MSALYPSSVFTSDINEQKLSVQRRSLSEQVDQNKSPRTFGGKIDININITNKVIKIHNKKYMLITNLDTSFTTKKYCLPID